MKKNMLGNESSPYLLQHQNNPVHWMPWSNDAFEVAKKNNVPVIVSIGYAACHWCHVMAHECFEDDEVADAMNDGFVCIKVDREELPHVDSFYMDALHAMGEQGGWPLTMFADWEGKPMWGGTYFPKNPKYGRPGFLGVLSAIRTAWEEERDKLRQNTKILVDHLGNLNTLGSEVASNSQTFDAYLEQLLMIQDPVNGGTKGAPKFPNAPILDCLRVGYIHQNNAQAKDAFLGVIYALARGGIYDHIGGGLCRYSVDERWLAPHFEKMLYDNAYFIRHLAMAYQTTQDELFTIRINQIVGWLKREMLVDGAFAASLDADSEGEEGKYYVWGKGEVIESLGEDGEAFCEDYDITEQGNWESKNIANLLGKAHESLAEIFRRHEGSLTKLLEVRTNRIPPARDTKILVEWNGLMIEALADAFGYVGDPNLLSLAEDAYRAVMKANTVGDKLVRCKPNHVATAADLAAISNAALALYEQTTKATYLEFALKNGEQLFEEYSNEDGALFQVPEAHNELPVHTLAFSDDANFSGGSHALRLYTRLFALTNNIRWHERAESLEQAMDKFFAQKSYGNAGFLAAKEWRQHYCITYIVAKGDTAEEWRQIASQTNKGTVIVVESADELPEGHQGHKLSAPFAIVCKNQTCLPPVEEIKKLEEVMSG